MRWGVSSLPSQNRALRTAFPPVLAFVIATIGQTYAYLLPPLVGSAVEDALDLPVKPLILLLAGARIESAVVWLVATSLTWGALAASVVRIRGRLRVWHGILGLALYVPILFATFVLCGIGAVPTSLGLANVESLAGMELPYGSALMYSRYDGWWQDGSACARVDMPSAVADTFEMRLLSAGARKEKVDPRLAHEKTRWWWEPNSSAAHSQQLMVPHANHPESRFIFDRTNRSRTAIFVEMHF